MADEGGVKEDLSRQLLTYGAEMVGKLKQMKVLVHGLRGLGIETVKNLVLAGPHTVTVHDDGLTAIEDLGSNFYLHDSDVGNPRGKSVLAAITELNPNVRVNLHTGKITTDLLEKYNVVCFCDDDIPLDELIELNAFCHAKNIGFMIGTMHGLAGSIFVDLGTGHVVHDADGEPVKTLIVESILNQEHGSITIDGDRHLLSDGTHIRLEEVRGMQPKNGTVSEGPLTFGPGEVVTDINQIHIVKTTKNPKRFTIGNTTQLGEYEGGGLITEVKIPVVLDFKPLFQSMSDPEAIIMGYQDFSKFSTPPQQHFALLALWHFRNKHEGELPRLHNDQDAEEVVAIAKELNNDNKAANGENKGSKIEVDEVDEAFVRKFALYARTEISPLCALFGGVLAQEITKYTGKYTPIRQWFHLDALELHTEKVPSDASPVRSRYDHTISIFGAKFQEAVEKCNVFVVGCGALGCEYLKMVATTGLGTKGRVHVTDDDTIELSNLSRQFLFRRKHVKKSKSECASQAVVEMNKAVETTLKVYQTKVEPKTEDVFNDEFWGSIDIVINALDNMAARKYVDSKCVLYQKPLFESGTLGTQANTAICLPHLTPSYSQGVTAGEGAGIAKCTLRNFPAMPLHCIEWAREMFDDWFMSGPELANNFLEDKKGFFDKLAGSSPMDEMDNLELCKTWVELATQRSPESCVGVMSKKFLTYYRDNIKDLTYCIPREARNIDKKTGADMGPFWSGAKRFPQAREWDPSDELQLDFLYQGANVLAVVFGLKSISREEVASLATGLNPPDWEYAGATVNLEENDKKKSAEEQEINDEEKQKQQDAEDAKRKALRDYLLNVDPAKVGRLVPVDFEKDDDSNHHVDIILAATNLRSSNYHIKPSSFAECRAIAGKIIPAIATTTACITGFVGLEVIKHILKAPLELRKGATLNLATNIYCLENLPDPVKAKTGLDPETYMTVRAVPEGFTTWDTIVVNAPDITLQEFITQFSKLHHGAEFTMLSTQNKTVYSNAPNYAKQNPEKLRTKLLDLVIDASGPIFPSNRNYVVFDGSVDVEGDDGIVPRVKWVFRN